MKKHINDKVKDLTNGAGSQEELMKALAQIDEEGILTDDVLDAVSGGALSGNDLGISTPIGDIKLPWKINAE